MKKTLYYIYLIFLSLFSVAGILFMYYKWLKLGYEINVIVCCIFAFVGVTAFLSIVCLIVILALKAINHIDNDKN
jgi:hypothetical protein